MRRLLSLVPLSVAISAPACTSDLRAPTNYLLDGAGEDATAGGALTVVCGALTRSAVGATLTPHQVMASGGAGGLRFEFADPAAIPAGLTIDPARGEISGVPEAAGDNLEFVVRVTDADDESGQDTCTLDVSPRLAVQLRVDAPGCLSGNASLHDVVLPDTGDGTPITCSAPGGRGNGALPMGVTVGTDSCQLEGPFQDERFGTWVSMMRGEQSGAEVWVPFCVTNDDPGDAYNLRVAHSGSDDATFEPMLGTFDPGAAFALGMPGDPHFAIDDVDACGNNGSCFFGFSYTLTSNYFDNGSSDDLVEGDQLLLDDDGLPIGMEHDLARLEGSDLPESLRERPWTINFALDYCLTDDAPMCRGRELQNNVGARFQFSILMFPDPA